MHKVRIVISDGKAIKIHLVQTRVVNQLAVNRIVSQCFPKHSLLAWCKTP